MVQQKHSYIALTLFGLLCIIPSTCSFGVNVKSSKSNTRHVNDASKSSLYSSLSGTNEPYGSNASMPVDDPKFFQRNKHWIVLVDDEEDIRMAVGDFLYDSGYEVTACADADAAWKVCTEAPPPPSATNQNINGNTSTLNPLAALPDAIITDVRMPKINGLELLQRIRADERLKRLPVILLTAKAMTQDRIEGYKAGADAYLPKPFHPEELLSILDNLILRKKQIQGQATALLDLKQELENIKYIMKQNSEMSVRKTDVYLTLAERQVLELLATGCTNAEIADARKVQLAAVTRTLQRLYQKTNTRTRTELVRWAIQTGYIPKR